MSKGPDHFLSWTTRMGVSCWMMSSLLAGCALTPTRPCSSAGDFAGIPKIKGDKSCMQREDDQGSLVNHGRFIQFHPNGRVAIEGQFQDGKKSGVWAFYDESGAQTEERVYNRSGVQVGSLQVTDQGTNQNDQVTSTRAKSTPK